MCIKTPKIPPITAPRQAPTRAEAQQSSIARNADARARAAGGVFENIFTSALGDPTYGQQTRSRATATA